MCNGFRIFKLFIEKSKASSIACVSKRKSQLHFERFIENLNFQFRKRLNSKHFSWMHLRWDSNSSFYSKKSFILITQCLKRTFSVTFNKKILFLLCSMFMWSSIRKRNHFMCTCILHFASHRLISREEKTVSMKKIIEATYTCKH